MNNKDGNFRETLDPDVISKLEHYGDLIWRKYELDTYITKSKDGAAFVFVDKESKRAIADVKYNSQTFELSKINVYSSVIQHIKDNKNTQSQRNIYDESAPKPQQKKAKGKYSLKRENYGRRITPKGILALVLVGAITVAGGIGGYHYLNANAKDSNVIGIEQIQKNRNTLASANDLLLASWTEYAISELSDIAAGSEHEALLEQCEQLKQYYYIPVMNSLYSYIDVYDSNIPLELNNSALEKTHSEFRNKVYIFNERLEELNFDKITFDNSPYANAVVIDKNGSIVRSGGLTGEVFDSEGKLITYDDHSEYVTYIKASDIKGNDYSYNVYPDDAKFVDGIIYVSDEHLNDFENNNIQTKK